jgi:peptidoglycan/LPS O-acetylase OafA/YrhL
MDSRQITSLTGLRGIAAWAIVVYHFRDVFLADAPLVERIFSYGFYAVDLFFILSGFVIYLSTHAYFKLLPRSEAIRKFYVDRFSRIYPLHIFILIVLILNPVALHLFSDSGVVDDRYSLNYFVASIFLVQNWGFFEELKWNIPAWSISSELAAYLLFPLTYSVVSRLRNIRSTFFSLIMVLVIFASIHVILDIQSLAAQISKLGTFRCLFEFLIGVLIAKLYVFNALKFSNALASFLMVFVFLLFVIFSQLNFADYFYVPALMCIFIIALLGSNGFFSKALGSRLLCHLGLISYSVYLSHYFVKDWVKFLSNDVGYLQFAVYMMATYLISTFLYKFIENPMKIYLRKFRFGESI